MQYMNECTSFVTKGCKMFLLKKSDCFLYFGMDRIVRRNDYRFPSSILLVTISKVQLNEHAFLSQKF